jgi:ribosome maturation factor RimP
MATDLEHVRSIAQRVAESSGLELVDVELRGGGRHRMLRLVIDRPGGVTHEDCAAVSREVGAILDVEDAVPGGSYTLEVSSPGLDRKLVRAADYERFSGSRVKLMTREPIEGNRYFEGRLQGVSEGRLVLDLASQKSKGKRKKERQEAEGLSPHPVAPKAGAQGWGTPASTRVEIELTNVEKANLVPEI